MKFPDPAKNPNAYTKELIDYCTNIKVGDIFSIPSGQFMKIGDRMIKRVRPQTEAEKLAPYYKWGKLVLRGSDET